VLAAAQAADALVACSPPAPAGGPVAPDSPGATSPLPDAAVVMFALLGATATEPGRRAVVAALTQSPAAFRRLLQFVQVLA
jgi:hypothetical protein